MTMRPPPQFQESIQFTRDIPKVLAEQQAKDINEAALQGMFAMKRAAPIRTGYLRRSIQVLQRATPDNLKATVGTRGRVDYAFYQNAGFRHYQSGKWIRGKFFHEAGRRAAARYMQRRGYR